jgi:16S rRNA (adenine1518-N6/adenine1519-N6)-dimethyltransferase
LCNDRIFSRQMYIFIRVGYNLSMEKAIKSLGQNFLKDLSVVNFMVNALDIKDTDNIIEIGPGPGVFTKEIVSRLAKTNIFTAVELDPRFSEKLGKEYESFSNVQIIEDNFLEWIRIQNFSSDTVVLGAIPYYITSPIIHALIKTFEQPKIIVLMIQKEVAEKLCEKGVKPNYFSNFINTFYKIEYLDTVFRDKFIPVPKVDSAVIKFIKKQDVDSFVLKDIGKYENFLHRGFKQQKKMLNKVFEVPLLESLGISGTMRPHNLSVEDWIRLYRRIYEV